MIWDSHLPLLIYLLLTSPDPWHVWYCQLANLVTIVSSCSIFIAQPHSKWHWSEVGLCVVHEVVLFGEYKAGGLTTCSWHLMWATVAIQQHTAKSNNIIVFVFPFLSSEFYSMLINNYIYLRPKILTQVQVLTVAFWVVILWSLVNSYLPTFWTKTSDHLQDYTAPHRRIP